MDQLAVEVCPCCKRPMDDSLAFLEHLSAGYALIVRYVRRAGPAGIASDDLMELLYPRGEPESGVKILWNRVHRLNRDHLHKRGYEVVAPGGGHGTPGRYVFRVRKSACKAATAHIETCSALRPYYGGVDAARDQRREAP